MVGDDCRQRVLSRTAPGNDDEAATWAADLLNATVAPRSSRLSGIAVAGLSLAVLPQWPLLWLRQTHYYDHFIPLFVFPGPLLLLALFRYRDRDAWLLLLAALMPPALVL